MRPGELKPTDEPWLRSAAARLGTSAPRSVHLMGHAAVLATRRFALFCSDRAPGNTILRALDTARGLRDEGATVISGFHSPIEKESLEVLLRGKQPIIVCPARAIDKMRIPAALRVAFDAGRILFLSPFIGEPTRVTRESACRRNEVVAALADEAFIPYITPGGETERVANLLKSWGVPIYPSMPRATEAVSGRAPASEDGPETSRVAEQSRDGQRVA